MNPIVRPLVCASALVFLATVSVPPGASLAADAPEPAATMLPVPKVQTVVTHHTARIGGKEIQYTATAGTILLTNDKDQPTASVFYVAYTADALGTKAARPITFAYNGGPGASSALLHMGAFGPRMVVTANAEATRPAPYELVDNENSLLDTTDLVFIDAVGTGYSRIAGHGTSKLFYGIDQDSHAFEQFIRRYLSLNGRWNSPKYLAGESYGTTRSAVLANMLQNDGIALNGIVLISSFLVDAVDEDSLGEDTSYWLYLPTEAAVAAYHHKIPQPADMAAFLRSARAFAEEQFALALAKGAALPLADRNAMAQRLHDFIGLPVDYLVRSDLRVDPSRFEKTLIGPEGRTVGRYDGRFSGFDRDPIADSAESDPSADAIFGAFVASFNAYARNELNYQTDSEYRFLTSIGREWDWTRADHQDPSPLDVLPDLKAAMTANPHLRVFSANGIYDLATPFFETEYDLGHLGLAPSLRSNITFGYYPAGHMIYLNPVAHAALKRDLAAFYR